MRLISKIHDYYDGVAHQMFDPDDTRVWARKVDDSWETEEKFIFPWRTDKYNLNLWIVGFCGKFYVGDGSRKRYYDEPNISYDLASIETKITNKMIRQEFKNWVVGLIPDPSLFVKYHTPIFVTNAADGILDLAPVLKDYEFYKVFDPFNAWVELENFYHNYLLEDDSAAMVRISDEDMARAKGFTHPYSFKREPKK